MAHPEATLRLARWKSGVLAEALPYMRRYAGSTFLVKFGGHAMVDPMAAQYFAEDVVLMRQVGIKVAVVHGGAPQLGVMLDKLGVKSEFVEGLRVTTPEIAEIAEMVLAGKINKQIVAQLCQAGGKAVGLNGKDGAFLRAEKHLAQVRDAETGETRMVDLGMVGKPSAVDGDFLRNFLDAGLIPVIAPVGLGPNGETFNINSDTVAGAVAAALDARRFLLLTDVKGVLDGEGALIPELSADHARALMADGTIHGGMIPKVECCLNTVGGGVNAAVILDGRTPHALLLELFTEAGAGTMIRG